MEYFGDFINDNNEIIGMQACCSDADAIQMSRLDECVSVVCSKCARPFWLRGPSALCVTLNLWSVKQECGHAALTKTHAGGVSYSCAGRYRAAGSGASDLKLCTCSEDSNTKLPQNNIHRHFIVVVFLCFFHTNEAERKPNQNAGSTKYPPWFSSLWIQLQQQNPQILNSSNLVQRV